MSDMPGLEPAVVTAIEDYLRSLQAHASAEQMLAAGLRSFAAKDGPNGQLPAVSGGSAQRTPSRFSNACQENRGPLPGRRLSHPCIFWGGEESGRILVTRMSV
jgi:hypothetical protein